MLPFMKSCALCTATGGPLTDEDDLVADLGRRAQGVTYPWPVGPERYTASEGSHNREAPDHGLDP
jgi:hypothetical protein